MFKNLIGNIIDKGINKCGSDLIEKIQKFIADEYTKNKTAPTYLTDNFYKQLCEEKRTKELLEDIRKMYNIEQRNNCLNSPEQKKILDCSELNFSITNINIGYIRTKVEDNYFKCNPTVVHMISVFVDNFIKAFYDFSAIEESKKKSKTKKIFNVNLNLKKLQDSPLSLIFGESDCFKELQRNNPNYLDLKKSLPDNEEKHFKKHIDKLYNTKDVTYDFNKEYFSLILDVIYAFLTYVIKSIVNYTTTVVVKKRIINETHFQMCVQQLIDRIGNKNLNKEIENIWNQYKNILEEKKNKPKKTKSRQKDAKDSKDVKEQASSQPTPVSAPQPQLPVETQPLLPTDEKKVEVSKHVSEKNEV